MLPPKVSFIAGLLRSNACQGDKSPIHRFVVGTISKTRPVILKTKPKHFRPVFTFAVAWQRIEWAVGQLAFASQTAVAEGRGRQYIQVSAQFVLLPISVQTVGRFELFKIGSLQLHELWAEVHNE